MKGARHISGSFRAFQARKRRAVHQVLAEFEELRCGCAYTPVYNQIVQLGELASEIKDKLSVREWKRWRDE